MGSLFITWITMASQDTMTWQSSHVLAMSVMLCHDFAVSAMIIAKCGFRSRSHTEALKGSVHPLICVLHITLTQTTTRRLGRRNEW